MLLSFGLFLSLFASGPSSEIYAADNTTQSPLSEFIASDVEDFPLIGTFSEDEMARELEFNEEVIQKHQRYRKANNLDYSDQAILDALNSSNARETIPKYSIALTEEEERYIQGRDELMNKYGPQISNLLTENGVIFTKGPNNDIIEKYSDVGTFYQEKENGLKFVVGFSVENEKAEKIKKAIEELVPAEYLEIKKVNFSEAELVSAYESVVNESKQLGIPFETVAVRIKENVVEVQLADGTNATKLMASNSIKSLNAENSDIYKIVTGKSNEKLDARNTKLDTMVGGLLIADTATNSTDSKNYCTIGTLATKSSDRFIITAAHCLESWNTNNVYQGGSLVGTEHFSYNGNYADVGVIKVPSTKKISNYVYKYSWTDSRITSYQTSTNSLNVGDNVCLSGATSGFSCGSVTAKNITSLGNSGYMEADVVSLGGDSGGTWWYNGVLIGIHRSGDGASFARFSHISNAKAYGGDWTPYTSDTAK